MKSLMFIALFLLFSLAYAQDSELKQERQFSNESELSLIQTTGNTSVETYNLKTLSSWKTNKQVYSLGGHYTLGFSEETDTSSGKKSTVETARNWDASLKYEQVMSEKFSGYLAYQIEGDTFSGIKQRENSDFGAKYYFLKTKKLNSFTELGVRHTLEKRVERDVDNNDIFNFMKGRVYYEVRFNKSDDLKMKFWVEYLPNFTESVDYIITYEPSLIYTLTNIFSLKTAYKNIYDNQPNTEGNSRMDTQLTTSVLAKF